MGSRQTGKYQRDDPKELYLRLLIVFKFETL